MSWRALSSRAAPALVAALVWLAFASVCAATRAEAFESLPHTGNHQRRRDCVRRRARLRRRRDRRRAGARRPAPSLDHRHANRRSRLFGRDRREPGDARARADGSPLHADGSRHAVRIRSRRPGRLLDEEHLYPARHGLHRPQRPGDADRRSRRAARPPPRCSARRGRRFALRAVGGRSRRAARPLRRAGSGHE